MARYSWRAPFPLLYAQFIRSGSTVIALSCKSQAFIICSYRSMNETPRIPSPIPYLMQVPDLRAHNTTYDWRMLFMLVLMGLGSGRTNVLAIAQWTIPFGTEPWRACSPSG